MVGGQKRAGTDAVGRDTSGDMCHGGDAAGQCAVRACCLLSSAWASRAWRCTCGIHLASASLERRQRCCPSSVSGLRSGWALWALAGATPTCCSLILPTGSPRPEPCSSSGACGCDVTWYFDVQVPSRAPLSSGRSPAESCCLGPL